MRFPRRLAVLGVIGPLVFTSAWIVAPLFNPGYRWMEEDISALAARDTEFPWLMATAFVVNGLCIALAAPALGAALPSKSGRVGAALMALTGLGVVTAGLFRNDCSGELQSCIDVAEAGNLSMSHAIHDNVSGPVFLSFILVQLVIGYAAWKRAGWAGHAAYSWASAVISTTLLVAFLAHFLPDLTGVVQRLFVTVPFTWIAITSFRVWRMRGPAAVAVKAESKPANVPP